MKKFVLLFAGIALLAQTANSQASSYTVGDVVDDFTVTDTDGNTHSLYEITATGKHVYIDFFFAACGPCQATSPYFGEFYDKYGCNTGEVYCLVVNNGYDDDEAVIAYEEEFGGPGNHAPAVSNEGGGPDVTTNFGVSAFPTYILIGPDNRLVEQDIYPIADMTTFEGTFYDGFNPEPMACSFASITNEEPVTNLNIYPNPTADNATITFSATTVESANVTIYNLLGEVVYQTQTGTSIGLNTLALDVTDFNSANYIVQVQIGEGIITERLSVIR